jgi:hypothetical protein
MVNGRAEEAELPMCRFMKKVVTAVFETFCELEYSDVTLTAKTM